MKQILHILSASLEDAQRVLTAALAGGFRESGAVSLGSTKAGESNPMVAVRSAGYSFDSVIGYQDEDGSNIALVDEMYLRTLVDIANERFKINLDRIRRFRTALLEIYQSNTSNGTGSSNPGWEDTATRKQRKREEGLARQQALQIQKSSTSMDASEADENDSMDGMFSP